MENVDTLIQEMLNKITEEFGTAEEEIITENSYKFKNRTANMQNDLDFIQSNVARSERIYVKHKLGYDGWFIVNII